MDGMFELDIEEEPSPCDHALISVLGTKIQNCVIQFWLEAYILTYRLE